MKKVITLLIITVCCATWAAWAVPQTYSVQSPDKRIVVDVSTGATINYNVKFQHELVVDNTPVSITLDGGKIWGKDSRVNNIKRTSNSTSITSLFYKKSTVTDTYNSLLVNFKDGFALEFRVYNDGVAYRFISLIKKELVINYEEASFNFPIDFMCYVPYVRDTKEKGNTPFDAQFMHSFENTYEYVKLSGMDSTKLAFLPIVVETPSGIKLGITEADLEAYPGMSFNNPNHAKQLKAVYAPYPKRTHDGGHDNLQNVVDEYDTFMAKIPPLKKFPWRIIVISAEDKALANNDMVYRLASPSRIKDVSWIKPGKVAWDWWNDWGLYGVDFKAGINQDTYMYYIDFASKYGLEYVLLDDGWTGTDKTDLTHVIDEIDMPALVKYAKSKNVDIILWAGFRPFDKNMEQVCKHYSETGVKGFKVDFMDRDDQLMSEFLYRAAETAAKYKLLIDFHGVFKPTGLNRTYPNVINYEGVHGLEQMKWSGIEVDQVTYDVTMPYIRMLAGPVDYTQGAMRNAVKSHFSPQREEPMSQGTRCRQLAQYVVFESPLGMLSDSPTNYEREKESTTFISKIPTVWDQTKMLDGKISKYIVTARRKGDVWYIGGMTNWDARTVEIDLLPILGEGKFEIELFTDGANAEKYGQDYKRKVILIDSSEKLSVNMTPGGGFAARIVKK